MTYSQPQQQQSRSRSNRTALWVNDRKTAPSQPDYKGNVEISYALLQELSAAFSAGQYEQDNDGQPCIKLDIALYAQQPGQSASGRSRPILSGQVSTLSEMQARAAARQQYQQQQQAPQYQQPAPQYQQPAPQYQQAAPAPAPMPQYQPAPAPAPMPQQPAPAPAAPMAQPAPLAPVAPPPQGLQPMPGAIHAPLTPQPPAGL